MSKNTVYLVCMHICSNVKNHFLNQKNEKKKHKIFNLSQCYQHYSKRCKFIFMKFYKHLYEFISEQKKIALEEQKTQEEGRFRDEVDGKVDTKKPAEKFMKCYNCHFTDIPWNTHICSRCKISVTADKYKSMGLTATGATENVPLPTETSLKKHHEAVITVLRNTRTKVNLNTDGGAMNRSS